MIQTTDLGLNINEILPPKKPSLAVYTVFYQGVLYQETDFNVLMSQIEHCPNLTFLVRRIMRDMTPRSAPFYAKAGTAVELRIGGSVFGWGMKDDLLLAVREVA